MEDLDLKISKSGAILQIGDLPIIEANPLQMRRLFQNLISNAIKFSKKGESPKIEIESQILSEDWLRISVKDEGIGFDEDCADEIFQPFRRFHSREEYEGSGLGLALCKAIVHSHNGNLCAKGKINEGAKFFIFLPLRQERKKTSH